MALPFAWTAVSTLPDEPSAAGTSLAALGTGLYLVILAFNLIITLMTCDPPFSSLAPASTSPSSLGWY